MFVSGLSSLSWFAVLFVVIALSGLLAGLTSSGEDAEYGWAACVIGFAAAAAVLGVDVLTTFGP